MMVTRTKDTYFVLSSLEHGLAIQLYVCPQDQTKDCLLLLPIGPYLLFETVVIGMCTTAGSIDHNVLKLLIWESILK